MTEAEGTADSAGLRMLSRTIKKYSTSGQGSKHRSMASWETGLDTLGACGKGLVDLHLLIVVTSCGYADSLSCFVLIQGNFWLALDFRVWWLLHGTEMAWRRVFVSEHKIC